MSYGPKQLFTVAIASGTTTSSALDLGTKTFTNLAVRYTAGAALSVQASSDGTTFGDYQERVNTATVQYQVVTFPTASSGAWVTLTSPPVRFLRFLATAAVADGTTISVAAQD